MNSRWFRYFAPSRFRTCPSIPRSGPALIARARAKRAAAERGEIALREFLGREFTFQGPMGDKFIVDFVWHARSFVVEVDGGSHIGREEQDRSRCRKLLGWGYAVAVVEDHDARLFPRQVAGALHACALDHPLRTIHWRR